MNSIYWSSWGEYPGEVEKNHTPKNTWTKAVLVRYRPKYHNYLRRSSGTGKSCLAVAKALEALMKKEVNKIILTRPAIEAGERLGFLPGNLMNKVDPYLRPLYDSLGMRAARAQVVVIASRRSNN